MTSSSSTSQASAYALPPGQASHVPADADAPAVSALYCRRLTRARAKNFYYGMMLTPQPRRSAMYAVYAWMRAVDDLADEPGDGDAKRRKLEAFHRCTHAAIAGDARLTTDAGAPFAAIWPAVGDAFRRYHVPQQCLDDMIDGQLIDQNDAGYETFAPLYDYCYRVAGTVGLVCLSVWGYEGGDATRRLAEQRGVALQLTNILRDVVEDARRDRVYLPADELADHGFDAESFKRFVLRAADDDGWVPLRSDAFRLSVRARWARQFHRRLRRRRERSFARRSLGRTDKRKESLVSGTRVGCHVPPAEADQAERFQSLMRFQLARARRYYQQSATLESFVTPSCRPTCWALMRIYERLLRKMEKRPMRVLTERVRLPAYEKLLIAIRATLRRGLKR